MAPQCPGSKPALVLNYLALLTSGFFFFFSSHPSPCTLHLARRSISISSKCSVLSHLWAFAYSVPSAMHIPSLRCSRPFALPSDWLSPWGFSSGVFFSRRPSIPPEAGSGNPPPSFPWLTQPPRVPHPSPDHSESSCLVTRLPPLCTVNPVRAGLGQSRSPLDPCITCPGPGTRQAAPLT